MVPVTYLRAPVGYGKSGLVDEWINEHLACGFNVIYLDASELIEEILGEIEEPLATQQRVLASEDFSKSGQGPLAFAEERLMGKLLLYIEDLVEELSAPAKLDQVSAKPRPSSTTDARSSSSVVEEHSAGARASASQKGGDIHDQYADSAKQGAFQLTR